MCGLMAYSGKISKNQLSLLIDNCNDRGGHSWGCYFKDSKTDDELLLKGTGFINYHLIESVYSNFDLCLGISRLSTTYKINLEHSQPFFINNRYAVHNGVVNGYTGNGLDSLEVFKAIGDSKNVGAVIWIENDKIIYHEDLIKLHKKETPKILLLSSKKI